MVATSEVRLRGVGPRWLAGSVGDASAALEAAFEAAGLSSREARVIRERLAGRSHGEVGADVGLSRQRVAQVEAAALLALGVDVTIADLHAEDRAQRAEVLRARARLVRPSELHAEPVAWA